MDPTDVELLLERLLADDAPSTDSSEAASLFGLRTPSDDLAEVVEGDDPVTGRAGSSLRIVTFVGDDQAVAVVIDDDGRRILGQLAPRRTASVRLAGVSGHARAVIADDTGAFEIDEVPTERVQILIGFDDVEPRRTMKTGWSRLIDRSNSEPVVARSTRLGDDDLLRQRLARHLVSTVARPDAGTLPATTDVGPRLRPEMPAPLVMRTLAPAAQHETRPLPQHRRSSNGNDLDVVLAETPDSRLTITVEGTRNTPPDLVVSVRWTIVPTDGDGRDEQLVTPLPFELTHRRISTYDIGSALDVAAFGLGEIELVATDAIDPADVAAALERRPYGNAVRAWDELTSRLDRPALRAAFVDGVDQL